MMDHQSRIHLLALSARMDAAEKKVKSLPYGLDRHRAGQELQQAIDDMRAALNAQENGEESSHE